MGSPAGYAMLFQSCARYSGHSPEDGLGVTTAVLHIRRGGAGREVHLSMVSRFWYKSLPSSEADGLLTVHKAYFWLVLDFLQLGEC